MSRWNTIDRDGMDADYKPTPATEASVRPYDLGKDRYEAFVAHAPAPDEFLSWEDLSNGERQAWMNDATESAAAVGGDGWALMTKAVMDLKLRHVDKHEGDIYHALQSLLVKFGKPWDGKLTEPVSPPAGGFVVVPRVSTEAMDDAGREESAGEITNYGASCIWAAMIAAASPTAQPSAKDGVRGDATEFPEDFAHWWNYSPWSDASRWKEGYREVAYSAWLAAKATTAAGLVDDAMVDNVLFHTDDDETAMVIDLMGMGSHEKLPKARAVMRAALEAAIGREVGDG